MGRFGYQSLVQKYSEIKARSCESGLSTCSVLLFVAFDVDAIASARILCHLMRMDNISYTMYPVSSMSQLVEMYNNKTDDIKTVILLNCGAVLNIPLLFNLEQGGEDMKCYILDNHRPIHLANIHSYDAVICFDDHFRIEFDAQHDLIPEDGMDDVDLSDSEDEDEDDEDEDSVDSGMNEGDMAEEEGEDIDEGSEEEDLEDEEDAAGEEDQAMAANAVNTVEGTETDDVHTAATATANDSEAMQEPADEAAAVEEPEEGSVDEDEDDEDAEDLEEEEGEVVKGKKRDTLARKYDPDRIQKQKAKVYYGSGSSYAAPTSINLLWLLQSVFGVTGTRIPQDLIWQMILGITEQFLNAHISEDLYLEIASRLSDEIKDMIISREQTALEGGSNVRKMIQGDGENSVAIAASNNGNIDVSMEYRFYLYRHWTLYESMKYSTYIASKLNVWQSQMNKSLEGLLVQVGVSKTDYLEEFKLMNGDARDRFERNIKRVDFALKFNLTNPYIILPSFKRYVGYNDPISAIDLALAASALLDVCKSNTVINNITAITDDPNTSIASISTGNTNTSANTSTSSGKAPIIAFNEAYDCLSMKNMSLYQTGIHTAISIQKAIVTKASTLLERRTSVISSSATGAGNSIVTLRKMRFCYIRDQLISKYTTTTNTTTNTTNAASITMVDGLFARPLVLFKLGQFIIEVQKANGKWKKPIPLVLLSEKVQEGTWLVVGISPTAIEQRHQEVVAVDKDAVTAADTVDSYKPGKILEGEEEEEEEYDEDGELIEKLPTKRRKLANMPAINNENEPPALTTGTSNFKKAFKWAKDRLELPAEAKYRDDFFDSNVIEIESQYVEDFLGELDHVLRNIN